MLFYRSARCYGLHTIKKLDLNIALVTSGVSYEHHTEVSTRCIESSYNKAGYNVGRIADNGSMYAKNNIGEEIDQSLIKGSESLFSKVDVHRSIRDIKNTGEYDYIVVPHVEISTGYDKEGAMRRRVYLGPNRLADTGDPF